MHWDPALIAFGMLYAPIFAIDKKGPDDNLPVLVRSRTLLLDENGREMGSWSESGLHEACGAGQKWNVQLQACEIHLEHQERVIGMEIPWQLQAMPVAEGWTVVTATYGFSTGHGNAYRGVTTSTLTCSISNPYLLTVESGKLTRKRSKGRGEVVSIVATISSTSWPPSSES